MDIIKGTYSSDEAFEIVKNIIQLKINFHEEKISLSDNEEDIKMRENRIKSLQTDLFSFRKLVYSKTSSVDMNAILKLDHLESNSHRFSLISGKFDLDDAREILMNAYRGKINFHKLKAFSMSESGEEGGNRHSQRAEELQDEANRLKDLLLRNLKYGQKVKIVSSISIEFQEENEFNVREQNLIYSN